MAIVRGSLSRALVLQSPANTPPETSESPSNELSAATPIPTSDKVVPVRGRPSKKSKKGRYRLKVQKDQKTKKIVKEDGPNNKPVAARKKLDFGTKGAFSRGVLMDNIRDLAKTMIPLRSGIRGKKRKFGDQQLAIVAAYQDAGLVSQENNLQLAVVSQEKVVPQVDLDKNTLAVAAVLSLWEEMNTESFDGLDIGTGPEWEKTRKEYEVRVHDFIREVGEILGPRKFRRWRGSVINSVVGTFLTQNAADQSPSNAFMILAAKYPAKRQNSDGHNLLDDGKQNTGHENEAVKDTLCMKNFVPIIKEKDFSTWDKTRFMKSGKQLCGSHTLKQIISALRPEDTSDFKNIKEDARKNGYKDESGTSEDLVDWEAVLQASPVEIADCLEGRGMNFILAVRIQAFLWRIKKDHGSFDLEWLRHVPRENANIKLFRSMLTCFA